MSSENKNALTSVQQGMVFHYLAEGHETGVDIEQIVFEIDHSLDLDAFRESWQQLVRRNSTLRCCVDLESNPPTFEVAESAAIDLQQEDWSGVAPDTDFARRLDDFLDADRAKGINISSAPLFRVTCIQLPNARFKIVWTLHHLILDGRSFALAILELFDIYDAIAKGETPPPNERASSDDYLDWLTHNDHRASLQYWQALLSGVDGTSALRPAASDRGESNARPERIEVSLEFSEQETANLATWANDNDVTLNAVIQAAWAIQHARSNDSSDVVIGNTRSGRAGTVENSGDLLGTFITTTPLRVQCGDLQVIDIVRRVREQHIAMREHEHAPLVDIQSQVGLPPGTPLFESLVIHDRQSLNSNVSELRPQWKGRRFWYRERTPFPFTLYSLESPCLELKLACDVDRLSPSQSESSLRQLRTLILNIAADPESSWKEISLLDDDERRRLTSDLNDTDVDYEATTIHELFSSMAASQPDAECVVSGQSTINYADVNRRADTIAARLQSAGVRTGDIVGISLDRSVDMVASVLGVMKTGAAYLPLDPDYPLQRILYCLRDSKAHLLITSRDLASNFGNSDCDLLLVDDNATETSSFSPVAVGPSDLAYTIYTSGSTGNPKGVMIQHDNAVNFFVGMDSIIERKERNRWLAVTSLSFDISILEILWTLTRGYTVVLAGGADDKPAEVSEQRGISFSLFYFASDPGGTGREKYDLVLKGAEFADKHGFEAIWTPERHFHAFGGLYPNPSVIGAAIAARTNNLGIRSGSVVLPLHHPIRVVEEWSLVDNLSNGKVGLSFASGWQPNDFVLAPDRYETRRESLYEDIETVRKLWRGDAIEFENPKGDKVSIQTLPRPVQKELPVWVTAAGNPETFKEAGRTGANLLTHLLGQTMEEVGEKVAIYRKARKDAGYSDEGRVTIMLHTLVGTDDDAIRELVRTPMKNYLRSAASLVSQYADAWTAYKRSEGQQVDDTRAFDSLSEDEMENLLDFAFERYFETSALFGTAEKCASLVEQAHKAGIDEIACLIDFGVEHNVVLEHLQHLNSLKTQSQRRVTTTAINLSDLILDHDISHLQCTPSGARTLLSEENASAALRSLDQMLVGGEPFPGELWDKLRESGIRKVVNMYGPTETTIWSTSYALQDDSDKVFIGTPIANTSCYILDDARQLVPGGVAGELYIGGRGVARGYLGKPELTDERFVDDPFATGDASKMYATGDIVRWTESGNLEFLGRVDHQVKIRGFRVELGEIESRLADYDAIDQAVVAAVAGPDGAQELVAYCKPVDPNNFAPQSIAAFLADSLPAYMVPSQILMLNEFPLTPNKKVDRARLPKPSELFQQRASSETTAPQNELESLIKEIWESVLGLPNIGTRDNFFEIGGHSLRAVQVQGKLREALKRQFPITDLFRFPTIEQLAAHLGGGSDEASSASVDRAKRRKQVQNKRRRGRSRR